MSPMPQSPSPASQSIEALIKLRRRVRWLIGCSGVSLTLAVLIGCASSVAWLDWWLRVDELGFRILLSATVWATVVYTLWRTLIGPLRYPLSDVFLAEQIERRYPALSGSLSSAMAFRQAGCAPTLGSAELQHQLIVQAERELQYLDPRQIVTSQAVRPAVWAGLLACGWAVLSLLIFPLETATAFRRLVWPWSNHPWPQSTVLQLLYPDGQVVVWDPEEPWRRVRGDVLELLVENSRGRLPEQVWLETQLSDETAIARELLPRVANSSRGVKDRARLAVTAFRGPLRFRVTGGDDRSMPWHTLNVVEPPTIQSYQIEVIPPSYTGRPVEVLATGATEIVGWLGSRVRFSAEASRPLRMVTLVGRDRAPEDLPLSPDGRRWTAEFVIDKPEPTAIWFQLRDREGFGEKEPLQFDVRGEIDALPIVNLLNPTSDQIVAPNAVIGLEFEARDDLGVRDVRLVWQHNADPAPPLALFDYVDPAPTVHETYRWNLEELGLVPGDRVTFRVEARDAFDIGPEHVAKSAPRTLLVVSAQEKRAELQARTGELVEELKESSEFQKRLREQTLELHAQLSNTGNLRPSDQDLLHKVELDQRNLSARLHGGSSSLVERAEGLREELRANHVQDPETESGLEQLAEQLRQLTRTTTPRLTHELTQAAKLLSANPWDPTSPSTERAEPRPTDADLAAQQSLELAARYQTDVIEALSELESLLTEWRSQRDVSRALAELAREQQELLAATAELGTQTLAKSPAELSPQQRADLSKLAARQRRQAERIQELEEQLQQLAHTWESQDEAAAQAAADTLQQLQDAQTQAHARQAAQDLAANRMGPAGALQRSVQQTLSELMREWSEQEPDNAEQLVKELANLVRQADELQSDHEELRKRFENPQAASEEAAALRRRTQRVARQLERLRLRRSAEHAQQAAEHLRQLERHLDESADEDMLHREHALAEAELQQLQEQLQRDRQQAEERLAREEFERIAQALNALLQRQKTTIAETERLELERQARGQWTRGQLRSLKDLAEGEQMLAEEAGGLARGFEQAPPLKAAMLRITASLRVAAERLAERQADAVTLRWERDAERRLEQLLAAWRQPTPSNESSPPPSSEPSPQGETAGPPGESIPLHVQLLLLRNWQADCLERTSRWHAAHADQASLSPEEQSELEQLTAEQGELAQLTQALIDQLQAQALHQPPPQPAPPEVQP